MHISSSSISDVDKQYDDYMMYRYGYTDIKSKLKEDDSFADLDFAKQYYVLELAKLTKQYPELQDIVIDVDTGELLVDNIVIEENPIEKQWNTYSQTYKQDLDSITRVLGVEDIEYERF